MIHCFPIRIVHGGCCCSEADSAPSTGIDSVISRLMTNADFLEILARIGNTDNQKLNLQASSSALSITYTM
jgi:hypothetical protein